MWTKEVVLLSINWQLSFLFLVRSENPPDILPKVSILYIKKNGEQIISCEADVGAHNSYLIWYRKNEYNDYIDVEKSKVTKEKIYLNGKHRDIHTLMFKSFSKEDVGEYTCVRKVSGKKTTTAIINIKMKA